MREAAAAAPPPPPPPDSAEGVRHRKKGARVGSWVVVDSEGRSKVVEGGKHSIMQRTGLPARDLRMLDPSLSYPSTVLGRERAIVVNLESIRSIITSQEMIFHNSKDPLLTPFVQRVQGVFRHRHAVVLSQESGDDGNKDMWTNFYDSEGPRVDDGGDQVPFREEKERLPEEKEEGNAHELKILPFEFVALEACLEATCSSLDEEARRLEQEAHPALDKLTSKISTLNLDRVRHIKSRLVAITGRVQKVRDEIEHLLDDDDDMAEMYLTEKLEEEQELENSSSKEQDIKYDEDNWANDETAMEDDADNEHDQASRIESSVIKNIDVEELEMILEAYFVQIEGTLNRLSALREYVEDTEDYINIMLDEKQNQLLQMGVTMTTATLVVGAFVALTGVFGMNVGIELFDDKHAGMPDFLWTIAGGTIGCIFCFVVIMAWCRYKGLL